VVVTEIHMTTKNSQHEKGIRLPTSFVDDPTALLYKSQWAKYVQEELGKSALSTTIYGLCYYDGHDLGPLSKQSFLVGCSDTGQIYVWKMPKLSEDSSTLLNYNKYPVLTFTVRNKTCLYALQFVDLHGESLLVVSGDGGIYFVNWTKQVVPYLQQRDDDDDHDNDVLMKPDHQLTVDILRHFKPHVSALEDSCIEVNDFSLDKEYIYGAAGDSFGCYKWNIERGDLVATYKPRQTSYLHTVNKIGDHSILFGGEDGCLELWDTQADKCMDSWSMGGWVGASAIAGDWWHVGGGRADATGFAASFHGPTRSLATNKATPETIQYMLYDESTLYSVGSESFVSYWQDPCTLRQRQKVWCTTTSGFATAVSKNIVAVAGEGSTVDLFDKSVPFCQFQCS
jgi:WD40 repeat protein